MSEQHTIRMVAWTPVVGRKLPFVRRSGEDLYNLIIGKIEADESDNIALMRAVYEQTGGFITPGTLDLRHKHAGLVTRDTRLELCCYDAQHSGELLARGKYDELAWFDIRDHGLVTTLARVILDEFHPRYLQLPLFAEGA